MRVMLLPGDGIGPEVLQASLGFLRWASDEAGLPLELAEGRVGGAAIDVDGTPLSKETLARCVDADAVLLGAVGGPAWDDLDGASRPERGLLALRRGLGVYANLRPVRVWPELAHYSVLTPERAAETDLVIVRELTGGLYFGPRGCDGGRAWDTLVYTPAEIRRVARVALSLAERRRGRVTSVDKANVLDSSRLWREVVEDEARGREGVWLDHLYVDNAAMQLVTAPAQFDILLTGNLFGDILSDLAGATTGSLGTLPSASIGEGTALYEPVHGSAPDIAGTGVANPMGMILSVALCVELTMGQPELASRIREAVRRTVASGRVPADLGGQDSTAAFAAAVREAL